jgi:hypothetical protein
LNGNLDNEYEIILPEGHWEMVVNSSKAGFQTIKSVHEALMIPPSSGVVLRKLRVSNASNILR